MAPIIIALAALAGGVLAALLGYFGSAPVPFDPRKFGASFIRAVLAAMAYAISYQYLPTGITIISIFGAILGGAGVDVLGNRISAAIQARLPKIPTGPATP